MNAASRGGTTSTSPITPNAVDLVTLIQGLSEAETSLRDSWNRNFKRLHDGQQLDFSVLKPSIQELIRTGRSTAESLKRRADSQYLGIEELVDSVTALWDSLAEHRGIQKFALHNVANANESSPYFPVSGSPSEASSTATTPRQTSSSSSGANQTTATGVLRPTSSASAPPTPRKSHPLGSSYNDSLFPTAVRRDSDVSSDEEEWEIVNNEATVNGGTPSGKKERRDDDDASDRL